MNFKADASDPSADIQWTERYRRCRQPFVYHSTFPERQEEQQQVLLTPKFILMPFGDSVTHRTSPIRVKSDYSEQAQAQAQCATPQRVQYMRWSNFDGGLHMPGILMEIDQWWNKDNQWVIDSWGPWQLHLCPLLVRTWDRTHHASTRRHLEKMFPKKILRNMLNTERPVSGVGVIAIGKQYWPRTSRFILPNALLVLLLCYARYIRYQ